jgi:hypothetical protein
MPSPCISRLLDIVGKDPSYIPNVKKANRIYKLPSKKSLNNIMTKHNNSSYNTKISLQTFMPKVLIGKSNTNNDYKDAFFIAIKMIISKFINYCEGYVYRANIMSASYIIDIILLYYFDQENQDNNIREWLMENMTNWHCKIDINYYNLGINSFEKSKMLHLRKYPHLDYNYQTCIDNFIFNIVYQISRIKKQFELLVNDLGNYVNFDVDKNIIVNTTFWYAYSCSRDF